MVFVTIFLFSYKDRVLESFFHSKELNSAILLVFLIGTIFVFKNIFLIVKEQEWFENFLIEKNTSNNYSPVLLKEFKDSLTISEKFSYPSNKAKEIIDRVTVKLDSEREIVKYITALLVFLGLLGTFWGLLLTIDSVGNTISNLSIDEENILTNFSNLKEGLNAPLNGMGIAFSSSLFGLAGSLCLGFIELQGSRAQNDFLIYIENKTFSKNEAKGTENNIKAAGLEYIQAVLYQTVEGIRKLEETLQKTEDYRKNNEKLLFQTTNAISKINNEIDIRINQFNKNEIANIENLRSIDETLKALKEEINSSSRNLNSEEIAKELKVLAKTISLIKK